MQYISNEHKIYVEKILSLIQEENYEKKRKYHCLFYILGTEDIIRNEINKVFDFSKKEIVPNCLNMSIFDDIQKQKIRLAFHLFCGWCYESDEDAAIGFVSKDYTLCNLLNEKIDLYTFQYVIQFLQSESET